MADVEMVVIDDVRYRREDAVRLGLLKKAEPELTETETVEVKARPAANKARTAENKGA